MTTLKPSLPMARSIAANLGWEAAYLSTRSRATYLPRGVGAGGVGVGVRVAGGVLQPQGSLGVEWGGVGVGGVPSGHIRAHNLHLLPAVPPGDEEGDGGGDGGRGRHHQGARDNTEDGAGSHGEGDGGDCREGWGWGGGGGVAWWWGAKQVQAEKGMVGLCQGMRSGEDGGAEGHHALRLLQPAPDNGSPTHIHTEPSYWQQRTEPDCPVSVVTWLLTIPPCLLTIPPCLLTIPPRLLTIPPGLLVQALWVQSCQTLLD